MEMKTAEEWAADCSYWDVSHSQMKSLFKQIQRDALLEAAEILKKQCLIGEGSGLYGPSDTLIAYQSILARAKEV